MAWKRMGLSKKQAYLFLQDIMDMKAGDAHIASFDKDQCRTLVLRIAALKEVKMSSFTGVTFSGPDSNIERYKHLHGFKNNYVYDPKRPRRLLLHRRDYDGWDA